VPDRINGIVTFAPEYMHDNTGFDKSFFQPLFLLEKNHFWFQSRNELILWALKRFFPGVESFLEIGCGTGFVLSGIKDSCSHVRLLGSDIFIEGLKFAQERMSNVELFQLSAMDIPFENEFDVIGAFDVLEHIEEDDTVLNQMFHALKDDGGAIITVPQHPFLWSTFDDISAHKRRYVSRDLKSKVEAAGFHIAYMTSFVFFLFPFMLLSRFVNRSKTDIDPLTELKVHSVINRMFKGILDIERFFIRSGLSLPFGGSLLLILNKADSK
jgi:SAM-dependent methyltransferase